MVVEQPPCCWCGKPGSYAIGPWPIVDGERALMSWCPADKPDSFAWIKDNDEPERR